MKSVNQWLATVRHQMFIDKQLAALSMKGIEIATIAVANAARRNGDDVLEYLGVNDFEHARLYASIRKRALKFWLSTAVSGTMLTAAACLISLLVYTHATLSEPGQTIVACATALMLAGAWITTPRSSAFFPNPEMLRQAASSSLTLWGIGDKAVYHTLKDSNGHFLGVTQTDYAAIHSATSEGEPDFHYVRLNDLQGRIISSMNQPGANHARALKHINSRLQNQHPEASSQSAP
jgi:hypothetical protein